MNDILKMANELKNEMVKNRRHLHSNPEVGLELPKTSSYVMRQLKGMGIEGKKITNSGITATIGSGGRTILLRADMDALPSEENTNLEFKSKVEKAHLCGHDMHTAILLGAAKILKQKEKNLKGTIKLMFQPGEEIGEGAKEMVEAGILENPKVDAAMALHMSAEIRPGKLEYKRGVASSSLDAFLVEVRGKGGHSSTPHLSVDPLYIVNQLYNTLYSLIGREADPSETVVFTIGKMGGGSVANIIPDKAVLEGTLRCYNPQIRKKIDKRIEEVIDNMVITLRGSYKTKKVSTPSVVNDDKFGKIMEPFLKEIVGEDNFKLSEKPLTGTEDFSYISQNVPSLYMWLGGGFEDNYPLHNPNVVFDEDALPIGAAVLANSAINWLEKEMK